MSTGNATKINQLLSSQPKGVVLQALWLSNNGYSPDLQKRYRHSRWLESIGTGAMIRSGDQVGYEGAIYALQKQTDSTIHPAGRTALSMLGKTHYLELSTKRVTVFGGKGEKLPLWFQKHDWGITVDFHQTECYELMLGLNNLRPDQVQELLEKCQSVKVKRLFVYMAEKAGHGWMSYVDLKKIDMGIGKRSIVKDGVYVSKYQITVPKTLEEYDKRDI